MDHTLRKLPAVKPYGLTSTWYSLILFVVVLGPVGCAPREAKFSMQKIGPQQSNIGDSAAYTITLNNVGDGRATDVIVRDSVPSGMRYVTSSPAGSYDSKARAVLWELGTLEAGAGTTLGVTLRAEARGERCNLAEVEGAGDVRGTARSCTILAGVVDLTVSVLASPDPVEAGFTTTYTIDVKNQGSKTATDIRVNARVPAGLVYVSSSGPTASRVTANVVRFEPLPTLPPGASIPYRILARAQIPGVARLVAEVEADHLTRPTTIRRSIRVSGNPALSSGRGTSQRIPDKGLIHLGSQDQIGRLVSVENVLVQGRVVTGRVANSSSRTLRNVYLTIRSVWLWDDERNPGKEDPSTSVRYKVPGKVPAQGFLPFFYRPLPEPPRPDGRYETRVSIAEFSEVP